MLLLRTSTRQRLMCATTVGVARSQRCYWHLPNGLRPNTAPDHKLGHLLPRLRPVVAPSKPDVKCGARRSERKAWQIFIWESFAEQSFGWYSWKANPQSKAKSKERANGSCQVFTGTITATCSKGRAPNSHPMYFCEVLCDRQATMAPHLRLSCWR